MLSPGGRLTHWTTDTEARPTRSMALKTMKQQTQVKTLSAGEENKTAQLKARRVGERPPVAAPAHDAFRSETHPRRRRPCRRCELGP